MRPAACAVLAAALMLAGCAPGATGPEMGAAPRSSAPAESKSPKQEVVVVEKSNPEDHLTRQLRSQESEISQLRSELNASRSRSDAAEAAATEAQTQVKSLQTQLTNMNARIDTTAAQSEKALQISTEFLSNLVAAREEQKSLIERNLRTFDAIDQRLKNVETLVAETRRQRQSDVTAAQSSYSETDQRLQKADSELAQLRDQLTVVNRQNQEMRAVIDSGAMMGMLRDMEAMRRDNSQLRGAVEEVQRQQEAERKRLQNYYLDLDSRIQALQDKQAAAHKSGATSSDLPGDSAASPAQDLEQASPSSVGVQGSSTGNGSLPPLEIAPYGTGSESDASGQHESTTAPSGVVEKKQAPPVAGQGQFTTDWGSDTPSPAAAPGAPAR